VNTKKIYVIRHGETEYNKQGRVQGCGIDAPLNDTGLSQAAGFYQHYKNLSFDKIYCSKLQRTVQSVQGFIDDGIPYEQLAGFNEISWGEKEGKHFQPSYHEEYKALLDEWRSGNLTYSIKGGEGPQHVMERQKEAMNHVLKNTDEKRVILSIHGRALRILLTWLLNYDLREMEKLFVHQNLSTYELTYTGSMFSVDVYNNLDHLNNHR